MYEIEGRMGVWGETYRLKAISKIQNDLALNAPESFNFILLRKIEVEEPEVEINVSWIYELKFRQEWEVEIFFVQNNFSFYDFSVISLE